MFQCKQCRKTIMKVEDVRNCATCGQSAQSIPVHHEDSDWLTPAILGYMVGQSFHTEPSYSADTAPAFSGSGGDFGGGGASSSWNDSSSSSGSSDSSSSSSDSSSSDSGSSSSGSD